MSPTAPGPAEKRPQPASFIRKLYAMLEAPALDPLIAWGPDGAAFTVRPGEPFTQALAAYFKHANAASFVRQLNMYGFHKVEKQRNSTDPRWEFRHSAGTFRRGDVDALARIKRRSFKNTAADAASSFRLTYDIPPAEQIEQQQEEQFQQNYPQQYQYYPEFVPPDPLQTLQNAVNALGDRCAALQQRTDELLRYNDLYRDELATLNADFVTTLDLLRDQAADASLPRMQHLANIDAFRAKFVQRSLRHTPQHPSFEAYPRNPSNVSLTSNPYFNQGFIPVNHSNSFYDYQQQQPPPNKSQISHSSKNSSDDVKEEPLSTPKHSRNSLSKFHKQPSGPASGPTSNPADPPFLQKDMRYSVSSNRSRNQSVYDPLQPLPYQQQQQQQQQPPQYANPPLQYYQTSSNYFNIDPNTLSRQYSMTQMYSPVGNPTSKPPNTPTYKVNDPTPTNSSRNGSRNGSFTNYKSKMSNRIDKDDHEEELKKDDDKKDSKAKKLSVSLILNNTKHDIDDEEPTTKRIKI